MLCSGLFLKAVGERLINLLMAMQLVSYIPLYRVDYPAELELYINSLRKIAEFDVLPTDDIKAWLIKQEYLNVLIDRTK